MTRARSILLDAALFALFGPLFGTLAYAALAFVASNGEGIGGPLLAIVWLLPFGYLFGALPAAVTGAVSSALVGLSRRAAMPWVAGVLGVVVCGLVAVLDGDAPAWSEGARNLAIIGGVSGVLAAFAVRLLDRGTRRGTVG